MVKLPVDKRIRPPPIRLLFSWNFKILKFYFLEMYWTMNNLYIRVTRFFFFIKIYIDGHLIALGHVISKLFQISQLFYFLFCQFSRFKKNSSIFKCCVLICFSYVSRLYKKNICSPFLHQCVIFQEIYKSSTRWLSQVYCEVLKNSWTVSLTRGVLFSIFTPLEMSQLRPLQFLFIFTYVNGFPTEW